MFPFEITHTASYCLMTYNDFTAYLDFLQQSYHLYGYKLKGKQHRE